MFRLKTDESKMSRLVKVDMFSGGMVVCMRRVVVTPRGLMLACLHFALSLFFVAR